MAHDALGNSIGICFEEKPLDFYSHSNKLIRMSSLQWTFDVSSHSTLVPIKETLKSLSNELIIGISAHRTWSFHILLHLLSAFFSVPQDVPFDIRYWIDDCASAIYFFEWSLSNGFSYRIKWKWNDFLFFSYNFL